ncbi:hypothetical protein NW756_014368 [Fusarium oxysporum]|nr:hypothetical protein NW753_014303 [Fusarium oxysporum]WKT52213.1 hypothetical protein QSH57_002727 [Fusarium oxysporum f. sp. vasinfectum]KAJ4031720.1 hypothetical protein NW763_014697 [Fusarium oxysporum]KAJ4073147.1 hypothetical protein NW756_014368 [Fusarium oxysporum]KAJ4083589.1 hypothetical protein NW769_014566 [Fusarium oxysporum]
MDGNNSLFVQTPVEEESGGVAIRRPDVEADADFDILSFIESSSDRHETGHEMEDEEYRKQEKMLMDSAIDFVLSEVTDENVQIATVNPHPKLSIAHDLVSFLLSRKAATSYLFRRHPIPSSTTPQPFPLNVFMGKWTSWTSFTLSKSREVQPGTLQCSQPMKPGDIEVITVSNDKFVQLMSLVDGDEMLMMTIWETPDASRHVSPHLELMKPNFGLVEEIGERVIAWRVHGLDVSYYMDRLGYRIPGMVWPLEELSEE